MVTNTKNKFKPIIKGLKIGLWDGRKLRCRDIRMKHFKHERIRSTLWFFHRMWSNQGLSRRENHIHLTVLISLPHYKAARENWVSILSDTG